VVRHRILEGRRLSIIIPLIGRVPAVCDAASDVPASVFHLLVFEMDFMLSGRVSALLELVVNNIALLFVTVLQHFDFCCALIARLIALTSLISIASFEFWGDLEHLMRLSDAF
jgi:hypothetical protein